MDVEIESVLGQEKAKAVQKLHQANLKKEQEEER